jgi:hypothetical protein
MKKIRNVVLEFPISLTKEEEIALKWQYKQFGGFFTLLMEAISKADPDNFDRLTLGFPDHTNAYWRYTTEAGWWPKVQEKARSLGWRIDD